MPAADVVVVGAGLAGLTAAIALADRGASVAVVAAGHAGTHWAGGPIDIAAPTGAGTAADGLAQLTAVPGHPYATVAGSLDAGLAAFLAAAAAEGLAHAGALDAPLAALPTGIGATRPVSIVPAAQAAALAPWAPGERLVVVGPAGFKDFWPDAVAASLARPGAWGGRSRPAGVVGLTVDLPGLADRRNRNALVIARQFDASGWRADAIAAIGRAVDRSAGGPIRIGFPAVLGITDHAAVLDELTDRLGAPVMELPLVPPGIPGLRLYEALRRALRARGGRLSIGEPVARVLTEGRRVRAVALPAAARELTINTDALVLATGGIAAGGIIGDTDGRLRESVLGLPVDGPPIDAWLDGDPLDPPHHRIASAGLRTDADLRPIDPARPGDGPLFDNVRVAGGLLAGQQALAERCGDGVALASAAHLAAAFGGAVAGAVAGGTPG